MGRNIDPILKQNKTVVELYKILERVHTRSGRWTGEVLRDWLSVSLFSVMNGVDIKDIDAKAHRDVSFLSWYKEDVISLFSEAHHLLKEKGSERCYTDILGPLYMSLSSGSGGRMGQFFTPQHVADMMSVMMLGDMKLQSADRLVKVCEPACGSGVMILSACRHIDKSEGREMLTKVHFTGIDLDIMCAMMTALQLEVYGVPNFMVYNGNALNKDVRPVYSKGLQIGEERGVKVAC